MNPDADAAALALPPRRVTTSRAPIPFSELLTHDSTTRSRDGGGDQIKKWRNAANNVFLPPNYLSLSSVFLLD